MSMIEDRSAFEGTSVVGKQSDGQGLVLVGSSGCSQEKETR
jgi:hypothetical protein